MARTTEQISAAMKARFMANQVLANLYNFPVGSDFNVYFSVVSVERLWFYILAEAINTFEKILDTHKQEIQTIIVEDKAHRPQWYQKKVLNFQYGFQLIPDTDVFDNGDATPEEIEASKIIKHCSVPDIPGIVPIKIAAEVGGVKQPVDEAQLEAVTQFVKEIKDAGMRYQMINIPHDILILEMVIYRDAMVLTETGMSILDGNYPVIDAIDEFIDELPFDGEIVLDNIRAKMRATSGVKIPELISASIRSYNTGTEAYDDPVPINVKVIPRSGYIRLENSEGVSYVV